MISTGQTGDGAHCIGRHRLFLPRDAGTLIKQGKSVAQSPVGQPTNQPSGIRGERKVFTLGHIEQPVCNLLNGNAHKVKSLTAGQDGCR